MHAATAPRPVTGLVARPRLHRLLDQAGRVTLISAPAGSGKTMLVTSWLDGGEPVAADTTEEVDAALTEVQNAAANARDHAGDQVDERVDDAADALSRAADGVVGTVTADDAFSQDVYQSQLDGAISELDGQSQDVRHDAPEVEQVMRIARSGSVIPPEGG